MSGKRRFRAGAAAGFILTAGMLGISLPTSGDPPVAPPGDRKETDVATATKQTPTRRVPPLDAAAPGKFGTATFALG